MDRATKRRLKALQEKYPEELKLYLEMATKRTLQNLLEGMAEDTYNTLREFRIGEERAGKATNKIIENIAGGDNNRL
ncbi:hypothetical protein [Senegalia massiliensis]|uniref:hypothetical protein n=1 Tax=Senegalia massiliensis TaxID=1720316 RepID=UPI0010307C31|nr:hypothetical protein [Senegalia massiliensis]